MGNEDNLNFKELNRFMRLLGRVLKKFDHRILLEAKFRDFRIERLRRYLVDFAYFLSGLEDNTKYPGISVPFFYVCTLVQWSLSHERDMLKPWGKIFEAIEARKFELGLPEETLEILRENSEKCSAYVEAIRKTLLEILKELGGGENGSANSSAGSV